MNRLYIGLLFLFLACSNCLGQDSYKGLTPGRSTRFQVEREFGQPVKNLSDTLFEYMATPGVSKIYVQYSEGSPQLTLRIELLCDMEPTVQRGCFAKLGKGDSSDIWIEAKADALIKTRLDESNHSIVTYLGSPDFIVYSLIVKAGKTQYRTAFYSRELYASALPKSGCTGLWYGVWDTNRGRMVLASTNDPEENSKSYEYKVKGSFSTTGTITGTFTVGIVSLTGEWKDETGSGTMDLTFSSIDNTRQNTFTGTWKRTSGKGVREGTWEGRCVETTQ